MKECIECKAQAPCMGFDITIFNKIAKLYTIHHCPKCGIMFNSEIVVSQGEIKAVVNLLI